MRLSHTAIFLSIICCSLSGMDYNLTPEEIKECATLQEQQDDLGHDNMGLTSESYQALQHLRPYLPLAVDITKGECKEQLLEDKLKECSVQKLLAIAKS